MIASLITFCSFLRTTWALSRGSILESYTRVKHNESTDILLSQLAGSEELIFAPVSPGTVGVCVGVGVWGVRCVGVVDGQQPTHGVHQVDTLLVAKMRQILHQDRYMYTYIQCMQ